MGVFKLAEFHQLMADVKQFTSVLEEVHKKATDPGERALLGFAIENIKKGTADAQTAVPAAAEGIENEARRVISEGEDLKKQLAEQKVKIEALRQKHEQEEKERDAKRPTMEDMIGPVPPVNGVNLRASMFRKLHLEPPSEPDDKAPPGGKYRPGSDIWKDWLNQ